MNRLIRLSAWTLTAFTLISSRLIAQQVAVPVTAYIQALQDAESFVATSSLLPAATTQLSESPDQWVRKYIPHLNEVGNSLQLKYTKSGKMGTRYEYQHLVNGLPVWGSTVSLNVLPDQSVFIQDHTIPTSGLTIPSHTSEATHWLVVNHSLQAIRKQQEGYSEHLRDMHNNSIRERDTRLFLHTEDTMVSGMAFAPDPLSSAGVVYGHNNQWKHFDDSDYALINNQRKSIQFPAQLIGDSFALRNAFVNILDFSAPFTSGKKSKQPAFNFTRSQQGFKDVMVVYHIYETQRYLQRLNHYLVQYPIRTDPSAGLGDQSYFTYDPDTTLNFGLGGVPDAEDADVIVHEYTHAVSWDINPNDNMAMERRSIEEGICDVMAAVHSRSYTDFNWRRLFNFDAPNPILAGNTAFWAGRNANSTKTYLDLTTDFYKNSEIWSSCMLDIAEHIGIDTLVDVLLSSLLLSTNTMTMNQACKNMLITDSLLYGGRHMLMMGYFFVERKFGDFPVGLSNASISVKPFELVNTYGFATNLEPLTIRLRNSETFRVQVTEIMGRVLFTADGLQDAYTLSPESLPQGLYILTVEQNGMYWNEKIQVFR